MSRLQPSAILACATWFALCSALAGVGCSKRPEPSKALDPARARAALMNYADIAAASYADALQTARVLQDSVEQLLAAPSAERLARARSAWLAARTPYVQSEVFRFYDGPIDRY